MASINMSARADSEPKENAELVLEQLGMNMAGTIKQSLYTDLLRAKAERSIGVQGRTADALLADVDAIIARAEQNG